jgi:hypothetical protein
MIAQAYYGDDDDDDMMMYEYQFHIFIRPVVCCHLPAVVQYKMREKEEAEKLDISLNCHSNRSAGSVCARERRNFHSFHTKNCRRPSPQWHRQINTQNVCHRKQHCFTTIS